MLALCGLACEKRRINIDVNLEVLVLHTPAYTDARYFACF